MLRKGVAKISESDTPRAARRVKPGGSPPEPSCQRPTRAGGPARLVVIGMRPVRRRRLPLRPEHLVADRRLLLLERGQFLLDRLQAGLKVDDLGVVLFRPLPQVVGPLVEHEAVGTFPAGPGEVAGALDAGTQHSRFAVGHGRAGGDLVDPGSQGLVLAGRPQLRAGLLAGPDLLLQVLKVLPVMPPVLAGENPLSVAIQKTASWTPSLVAIECGAGYTRHG